MTTYQRFKALTRARKGTMSVVIVEEDVLLKLLRDIEAGGMAHADSLPLTSPYPSPDAITLSGSMLTSEGMGAGQVIAAPQMEMRIKLSPEARERLLQTKAIGIASPTTTEWAEIEDALTEIMFPPRRWVMGVDR